MIRQIDLAELSPTDLYKETKKKMNVVNSTLESQYWYHFFSLIGICQQAKHPLTGPLTYIIKKAHELHYSEAAIRLGLVKPEATKDGVSTNTDSSGEEQSSTPSSENGSGTGSTEH